MKIAGVFLGALLAAYIFICGVVYLRQRAFLFLPTSEVSIKSSLRVWRQGTRTIGYAREVDSPRTIWLMLHGNAGQAEQRDYMLPLLARTDSLYVLEYPGFGFREGKPSRESLNAAAFEAYHYLRHQNPGTPVCVIGESIGTGPACELARDPLPPDKIVLITPFDTLANVAADHFPALPVRLMLQDRWDNVAALQVYHGPVEIYGAISDTLIPFEHAKALADSHPGSVFHAMIGGHNNWIRQNHIRITR
jgi:hypothetical protein